MVAGKAVVAKKARLSTGSTGRSAATAAFAGDVAAWTRRICGVPAAPAAGERLDLRLGLKLHMARCIVEAQVNIICVAAPRCDAGEGVSRPRTIDCGVETGRGSRCWGRRSNCAGSASRCWMRWCRPFTSAMRAWKKFVFDPRRLRGASSQPSIATSAVRCRGASSRSGRSTRRSTCRQPRPMGHRGRRSTWRVD